MAASFISTSSSRADSIGHPRLRLVTGDAAHRTTTPVLEQSPKTGVLACLTADTNNGEVLRKASTATRERNGEFYAAIFSPRGRLGKMELRSLVDDAVLASRLGAKILWLDSPDEVGGLLQLANRFRIGRIFVRRQRPTFRYWPFGRTLYSSLLKRADGIHVDVVGFERRN